MSSGPDLKGAVFFDLSKGAVRLDNDAALLVPASAMGALLAAAPSEARAKAGGAVGEAMGARAQKRLGGADGVRGASLESAIAHLGGELALGGYGTLGLERWGRALVLHVTGAAFDAPDFYASLVASAVGRATGTAAYSTVLDARDGVRILIASAAAAQRVRGWLDSGVAWGDAIARLQGGAA